MKRRIWGWDAIRILCALLIYASHSIGMYGCSYGLFFDKMIRSSVSPVMTVFFVLSGSSIYYSYHDKVTFESGTEILSFYKKRAIAILPAYYLVRVIVLFFNPDQLRSWLILTPIETVGMQTWFHTLFGIVDVGGTWFVSCIILSYFVYPILNQIANSVSEKTRIVICILIFFFLGYSYFVRIEFGLSDTYDNPLIRTLEFAFGVFLIASCIHFKHSEEKNKMKLSGRALRVCTALLLLIIIAVKIKVDNGSVELPYALNLWISWQMTLLIIGMIIVILFYIRNNYLEKSRILQYGSAITYVFYLNQLYLWKVSDIVLAMLHRSGNKSKILVSLTICTGLAILIFEFFEKPVKKLLTGRRK